jgi:hypothetical protein
MAGMADIRLQSLLFQYSCQLGQVLDAYVHGLLFEYTRTAY